MHMLNGRSECRLTRSTPASGSVPCVNSARVGTRHACGRQAATLGQGHAPSHKLIDDLRHRAVAWVQLVLADLIHALHAARRCSAWRWLELSPHGRMRFCARHSGAAHCAAAAMDSAECWKAGWSPTPGLTAADRYAYRACMRRPWAPSNGRQPAERRARCCTLKLRPRPEADVTAGARTSATHELDVGWRGQTLASTISS